MKYTLMRLGTAGLAIGFSLSAHSADAQSRPFPTRAHYVAGFVPSSATSAAALASYKNWKSRYLKSDCGSGYYRVDNSNGDGSTFSEGQGYGMVLTAYFGDKAAFDGLWSFAKKNFNGDGLMGWHVTCGGATGPDGGSGSATDGDSDIGFGLIVAGTQWGGTYAETAKGYLATLKRIEFTTCSPTGRNLPNAGNWDTKGAVGGGCTASNTSYWMPAYYRVFHRLTGDAYWSKAADDVVTLYNRAANSTTGIIVNSVDQNGVAVSGQTYDYNSCRIPWRAQLDYLWYGTLGAKQWTTKLSNWVQSVGLANTVDGYNANGSPTGQWTGLNAFVGGFTTSGMSNSQSLVDAFATYFVSIQDDNGTYYGSSLRTLYLLMLSGNQWNPIDGAIGTDPGPPDAGQSNGDPDSGPPGTDGGVNGAGSSHGCACEMGGDTTPSAAGWALVALLLLRRRRESDGREVRPASAQG